MREPAPSLYEPINVYKALAPNIGIVDGPFEYLTVAGIRLPMPFTTRTHTLPNGRMRFQTPSPGDWLKLTGWRNCGASICVSPNTLPKLHLRNGRTKLIKLSFQVAFSKRPLTGSSIVQRRRTARRLRQQAL